MNALGQIVEAVEKHRRFVEREADRARREAAFGRELLKRWKVARERAGTVATPTGLELPGLALPDTDEPGEVARYLLGEGLPGEFPFVNAAYPQMYLSDSDAENGKAPVEEPPRLFAGLGLA